MAGLVPAIHDLAATKQDVDARHKAGHDEGQRPPCRRRFRFPSCRRSREDPMKFGRTAAWNEADFHAADADRLARDEDTVRRGFWRKARRFAARVPFAEDLLAAYYCA